MTKQTTYQKGLWAEKFAVFYLRLKGHRLQKARYKTPLGEIDVITETPHHLVFTEVKMRPTHEAAAHAITPRQKGRLQNAALLYLQENPTEKKIRFDVLLVNRHQFPIHLKNVFME